MADHPLTIRWSDDALADLNRFAQFLQEVAPDMAPSVAREIVAGTRIIGERPFIGRLVSTSYRQIVIRALKAPYILQYRINGDRVVILRVFHGREHRG